MTNKPDLSISESPYRVVTNGRAYRIQKLVQVGSLWWKRMEWIDRSKLLHPIALLDPSLRVEFATAAAAIAERDRLNFQHFHGGNWQPLPNTKDQQAREARE